MSGRAIIIIAVGVILVAATTLFRIEATSTAIVGNYLNEYLSQSAQNIAQSGVNMGLRRLADSSAWRAGYGLRDLLGGKVSVRVFDTTYRGSSVVAVSAEGVTGYHTSRETHATSMAFVGPGLGAFMPRAAAMTNAATVDGGGLIIDGRDHDTLGNVIAANGILGVFTTGSFLAKGSSAVGGTNAGGTDFAPKGKLDTTIVRANQVYPGGYPTTPDAVFGGTANGYPEGTLKTFAMSGQAGSQYVTDPSLLKYPLAGVTYVELASGATWSPKLSGSGVLIIHNASTNAIFKQPSGTFSGLLMTDDLTNLSGLVLTGAFVQMTPTPTSDIFGSSNGSITFSRQAIVNALGPLQGTSGNDSASRIVAWRE